MHIFTMVEVCALFVSFFCRNEIVLQQSELAFLQCAVSTAHFFIDNLRRTGNENSKNFIGSIGGGTVIVGVQ